MFGPYQGIQVSLKICVSIPNLELRTLQSGDLKFDSNDWLMEIVAKIWLF